MDRSYVLARGDRELDRLDLQGIIYRDASRRALVGSGIEKGMRVLDVGCGSGDLSRLAAELVGDAGGVLGIDLDPDAVRAARRRTAELGMRNVVFEAGEAESVAQRHEFDALVGRFFLMHQPAPGATLAAAARSVRPDGIVMMLESHMAWLLDAQHSHPHSELYDEIIRWKCRVVAAAGADIGSGLRLYGTFLDAALPAPDVHMEAPLAGGPDSPIYAYMAESVRSMLPMAATHAIGGFDAERVAELESRLREDVVGRGGVLVCWPVVWASCRLEA